MIAPRRVFGGTPLVIVFGTQVRDGFFTLHPSKGVLQLHELDEEAVLGHRALEVEAEPLLGPLQIGALSEIEEEGEIEHDRRGEDGISAEKVDLDLHRVT